jgi:uncharacterized protein YbjT (DUF2867 family)
VYAALTRAAWTYLGDAGSVTHLVQVVHKARLNDHELSPAARYRLGELCLSSNPITKDDLADALAPAALPPAIDHALKWLEKASPA